MQKTNPDEPIYPEHPAGQPLLNHHTHGLTKREHFAAMALQGILAGTSGVESLASIGPAGWTSVAVSQADALIAELNK